MRAAALGLAAILVAGSASAEEVRYKTLPAGEVSKPPPRAKVHHVSGHADGFILKRESKDYYTLMGEKQVDEMRRMQQPSSSCLTSETESFRMHRGFGPGEPGDGPPADWSPQSQAMVAMGRGPVPRAYHREEVVVRGDHATLETRDAVVDFAALGAKTVDQRSLPLAKVATLAAGVVVYALRSEGLVQFVVTVPPDGLGQHQMMDAQHSGAQQQGTMSSQCRHLRVATPVKRGDGAAATVSLQVFEPGETKTATQAAGVAQRVSRLLAVHLSTSWLSGDQEPLVSVTAGWVGPSEKVQVASRESFDVVR